MANVPYTETEEERVARERAEKMQLGIDPDTGGASDMSPTAPKPPVTATAARDNPKGAGTGAMANAYQAQVERGFAAQDKARNRSQMTPMERSSAARADRRQGDEDDANSRFTSRMNNQRDLLSGGATVGGGNKVGGAAKPAGGGLERGYKRVGGPVSGARQDAIDAQGNAMVNRADEYLKKRGRLGDGTGGASAQAAVASKKRLQSKEEEEEDMNG